MIRVSSPGPGIAPPAVRRVAGRRAFAPARRGAWFALLPVAAACLPLAAAAQATGAADQRHGLVIVPSASVQETFSDNVALSNVDKHSDFATQGTVGVHAASNSGRLRGSVDYSLTGITHSSQAGGDQFVNSLNANLTGELITNHLFVDVTGNISQSTLSAFGTQSVDTTSTNSNRTEVSTFGVAPYLRGLITPYVAYEARLNGSWTSAAASNAATSSQYAGLLHLGSAERGVFGWAADATTSTVQYSQGSLASDADSYTGTLVFNPNPDTALSLVGGVERNNYLMSDKKSYSNTGVRIRWQPSTRTSLNARFEHRYFGNSHDVEFSYRTVRSAWSFIDARDVTTSRTPTGGVVQAFTPIYLQLYELFASLVPDPAQRDSAVRQFLAQRGLAATTTVSNLFLTSQVVLQRTQSLTFSLLGVRDTVIFRVYKTASSGLGDQPVFNDGLTSSNSVRQTGASVDVSHRLSPVVSASTSVQYLRSAGDLATQLTTLKAVYLNLNTRVGPRGNLGGGVRHVIFDSPTSPYTENAVYATYSQSF